MGKKRYQAETLKYAEFLAHLEQIKSLASSIAEDMDVTDLAKTELVRETNVTRLRKEHIKNRTTALTNLFRKLTGNTGLRILSDTPPLKLTPEGAAYLQRIQGLFDQIEELRRAQERLTVFISTIDMGCTFWIPEALAKCDFFGKPGNAQIDLRIRVCEWSQVLKDVRDRIADFGIATEMPCGALTCTTLLNRPHVLLADSDHKLGKGKVSVEIEDLACERVAILRRFVAPIDVEAILQRKLTDYSIIEANNSAQLLSFVRNKLAVAIITPDAVPRDNSVRAVEIEGEDNLVRARDAIYTLNKSGKANTAAAERVRSCISSYWLDIGTWLAERNLTHLVGKCKVPRRSSNS